MTRKGKRYRLARLRTLALHEERTGRPWSRRYQVSSVTGWPINTRSGTGSSKQATSIWYVNDMAYCGRVVASFRSTRHNEGRYAAEKLAKLLNRHDWEEERRDGDRES